MLRRNTPSRKNYRAIPYGGDHVTRSQFAMFAADDGYRTDAEKQGLARVFDAVSGTGKFTSGASWKNPGFIQADDHPVGVVTWNDPRRLHGEPPKERRHYRLPTEAEWESPLPGTQTAYFWADDPDAGAGYANCADLTLKDKVKNFAVFNLHDGLFSRRRLARSSRTSSACTT